MSTQRGARIIYNIFHPNPLLNELKHSKHIGYNTKGIRKFLGL